VECGLKASATKEAQVEALAKAGVLELTGLLESLSRDVTG